MSRNNFRHTRASSKKPSTKDLFPRSWRFSEIAFLILGGLTLGGAWWLYNFFYSLVYPIFSPFFLDEFLTGFWHFGGVFFAYVLRKPGAAFFGELIPSLVELSTNWGFTGLIWGATQGMGAELVFLFSGYQVFTRLRITQAAALSSIFGYALSFAYYQYYLYLPEQIWVPLIQLVSGVISAVLLGGVFSMAVAHAMAYTGAFDSFRLLTDQRSIWLLKKMSPYKAHATSNLR